MLLQLVHHDVVRTVRRLRLLLLLILDTRMIPVVDAGAVLRLDAAAVRRLVAVAQRRMLVMTDQLMWMSQVKTIGRTDGGGGRLVIAGGDERLVEAVDGALDGDRVRPRARVVGRVERTVVGGGQVVGRRRRLVPGTARRCVLHQMRRRRRRARETGRRGGGAVPGTPRDVRQRRRRSALVPRNHPAARPTDGVRASAGHRHVLHTAHNGN